MHNSIHSIPNGSTPWDFSLKLSNIDLLNHLNIESKVYSSLCINFRQWREMIWEEIPFQASTDARIGFIKELAYQISQVSPDKNKPIILISLGSGGLLTEYYIDRYLVREGYQDLRWRLIDPCYKEQEFLPCLGSFQLETGTDKVKAFFNEQDYLNVLTDGYEMAKEDRRLGMAVLLSIHGPKAEDSLMPEQLPPGQMQFRFKYVGVEKMEEANSVFIFISDKAYKQLMDENIDKLAEAGESVNCDNCLRFSINYFGEIDITLCPSMLGEKLRHYFVTLLNDVSSNSLLQGLTRHPDKLRHLHYWIKEKIAQLKKEDEGVYLTTCFASDYDVSLTNLLNHCCDGQASLFAELNWNNARFFDLKRSGLPDSLPR